MLKRALYIIIGFYILQTASSCCDCPDEKATEKEYFGFELEVVDTSGFNSTEIKNPVYKNAIGIQIEMTTYEHDYSFLSFPVKAFSFHKTYAILCECLTDVIITNNIKGINIYGQETLQHEKKNISDLFRIVTYNNEQLKIDDFFHEIQLQEFFKLELVDFNNLPNKIVFTVEIVLEDETKLQRTSESIEFII